MSDNGGRRKAEVLAGLDPEQRKAVLAAPGPVRILAGAGTGKTRTITRRIAYQALTGQVDPTAMLAVTHSNRAAGELHDRTRSLGVRVRASTFHKAAMRQLGYFWSETGLPGEGLHLVSRLAGGEFRLLAAALDAVVDSSVARTDVVDLEKEVRWAKARGIAPSGYVAAAAGRSCRLPAEVLALAFDRYEKIKRSAAVLDFNDVIEQCSILLEENSAVADRVRRRYRCFIVDEYQDTDPAQQRLLMAWLGGRDNVTVVGDPHQTIYTFKGSDPSLLTGFATQYPGAVSISLFRDYRSTPQVVAAANRLMASASVDGVPLQGTRQDGPEPVLRQYETEAEETDAVAQRVRELIDRGTPAEEIAVLLRFNAQMLPLQSALQDAGIAVVVSDDDEFFNRREIRNAVDRLAAIAGQAPEESGLAALRGVLSAIGFDPDSPPEGHGSAREDWDALANLLHLVEELPDEEVRTVRALVTELHRRADAEHAPELGQAATITTIHKAKGLEWDVVFLPRLTEGSLPIVHATEDAEIEEERRLLYVGITRARELVEFSYAMTWGDSGRRKDPSRFLAQVMPRKPRSEAVGETGLVATGNSSNGPRYAVGERVLYVSYGLGRVLAANKFDVTVDFGGGYGIRRIGASDNNLSKLS